MHWMLIVTASSIFALDSHLYFEMRRSVRWDSGFLDTTYTRTMTPILILGHHAFEVFPCPLAVEILVVGDVLSWVCGKMGKDDMKFGSDFWLVRDDITIPGRTGRRSTGVRRISALRWVGSLH